MKKIAKQIVVSVLGAQIRRLRRNNNFKIVAVVGSIGKTSTKLAIAQTLSAGYRVQYQEGNYNDIVSVPLVFFGEQMPPLHNPFAWLGVFWRVFRRVNQSYPYDVVVLELGTDGPGQIRAFSKYIHADIAVVTAIALEHMEFFENLDEVAKEELSVAAYSDRLLVNSDLCDQKYLAELPQEPVTYGYYSSDYQIENQIFTKNGATFKVGSKGSLNLEITHASISKVQLYSLCAAAVVASWLEMEDVEVIKALQRVSPVSGRLQLLQGIRGSTIIDDTYNASPEATRAAIEVLYEMEAPQKIALLGNMNELGPYSEDAHTAIGELCDPLQLDMVVTLGPQANKYTAEAAKKRGCKVERCSTPQAAAQYIERELKPGGLILAKGSQNGVFAEEAVKALLANQEDIQKLVRQSNYWLDRKQKLFES